MIKFELFFDILLFTANIISKLKKYIKIIYQSSSKMKNYKENIYLFLKT